MRGDVAEVAGEVVLSVQAEHVPLCREAVIERTESGLRTREAAQKGDAMKRIRGTDPHIVAHVVGNDIVIRNVLCTAFGYNDPGDNG